MKPQTLVRIYHEGKSLLAIFPQLKEFNGYQKNNTCYSHVGQHSVANKEYYSRLKLANKADCTALVEELTSIGYNVRLLNK